MEDFQFLTCAYFSDGLVKNHQQTSDVMSSKGWDGSRRMKRASCFSAWRFLLRKKTPCATVLVGTLANGLFELEVVLLVHICFDFDCFDIQPCGLLVDVQTTTCREPCFGKHSRLGHLEIVMV